MENGEEEKTLQWQQAAIYLQSPKTNEENENMQKNTQQHKKNETN